MGKKRRHELTETKTEPGDTSKPTAVFQPQEGRKWTLSIALPGSIVANAQSRELQALLAGQIARALAVFCVDEIVIFDDGQFERKHDLSTNRGNSHENGDHSQHNAYTGYTDPNYFFAHILSYLECPPNLRKSLFPMHPDLQHAGMLPSLDMPHHLKKAEWCQYREGVTKGNGMEHSERENGVPKHKMQSHVNTGLSRDVSVEADIPANTRVTVKFRDDQNERLDNSDTLEALPVAPSAPREEKGYYWGYSVRPAESLSAVFTECPFDGGYDVTFGTSERGIPISDLDRPGPDGAGVPAFSHMMVVFGGVAGLEVAVKADKELQKLGVETPKTVFDYWVNLIPGQGSRTIRTEEAVWVGLMALRNITSTKGRN